MTNPNHVPLAWANIRLEGILWKLFQLFDDLNGVAADLAPPSGLGQHQGLLGCTFQLHSITLYQISLTFCAEPFFFTAGKPRLQTLQKQPGGKQISQLLHSGVEMEGLHDLIFAWENRFWSLKREDLARPRRPHGLGDANATCDLAYSHRETSNYMILVRILVISYDAYIRTLQKYHIQSQVQFILPWLSNQTWPSDDCIVTFFNW